MTVGTGSTETTKSQRSAITFPLTSQTYFSNVPLRYLRCQHLTTDLRVRVGAAKQKRGGPHVATKIQHPFYRLLSGTSCPITVVAAHYNRDSPPQFHLVSPHSLATVGALHQPPTTTHQCIISSTASSTTIRQHPASSQPVVSSKLETHIFC